MPRSLLRFPTFDQAIGVTGKILLGRGSARWHVERLTSPGRLFRLMQRQLDFEMSAHFRLAFNTDMTAALQQELLHDREP